MEGLNFRGGRFCTTSGLLTATGAEAVYDTTVTINFVIDGKIYTKTAITDGTAITTDVNTSAAFVTLTADQGCVLVWGLNADRERVPDLPLLADELVAAFAELRLASGLEWSRRSLRRRSRSRRRPAPGGPRAEL